MARTAKKFIRQRSDQIDVREFEDISIRFPGDAYVLATWIAMSDLAKSTPTCQPHTTLYGLARRFAMLYEGDYSNPLQAEDVMAAFRDHGILGNPTLRLETTPEMGSEFLTKVCTRGLKPTKCLAAPRIDASGTQ